MPRLPMQFTSHRTALSVALALTSCSALSGVAAVGCAVAYRSTHVRVRGKRAPADWLQSQRWSLTRGDVGKTYYIAKNSDNLYNAR